MDGKLWVGTAVAVGCAFVCVWAITNRFQSGGRFTSFIIWFICLVVFCIVIFGG